MTYPVQHARQRLHSFSSARASSCAPGERSSNRNSSRRAFLHLRGFRFASGKGITVVGAGSGSEATPNISHTICSAFDMCAPPLVDHRRRNSGARQSSNIGPAFAIQASRYTNALSTSASVASDSASGLSSLRGHSPALCRSMARLTRAKNALRRLGLASSSQHEAKTSSRTAGYAGGGSELIMTRHDGTVRMNGCCTPLRLDAAMAQVVSHSTRLRDFSQVGSRHSAPLISRKSQFNRDEGGFDRLRDGSLIGEGGVFQFHGGVVRQSPPEVSLRCGAIAQSEAA